MIAQLLNRSVLLGQLEAVEDEVARLMADPAAGDAPRRRGADAEPEIDARDYAAALEAIRMLRESGAPGAPGGAESAEERALLDERMFLSREPVLSLLQSALEEWFEREDPSSIEEEDTAAGGRRGGPDLPEVTNRRLVGLSDDDIEAAEGRRLLGPFETTDWRWVTKVGLAYGLRLTREKHRFNPKPAPPVKLEEKARLIVVGDWGSGLPRAQRVAELMREEVEAGVDDGVQVQVVHLGDVYYSGWKREYDKYFFPFWPVERGEADQIFSWALNGNHDMYSGGYGFFKHLLADPRFKHQAGSSWFSIENRYWRIVGLDTSWDEQGIHDPRTDRGLQDPQASELARMAAEDRRPFMLLSHHQLFSAYESVGPYMQSRLQPLLDAGRIRAWLWGHEHKCIAYEPFGGVEYGRCIGHGGVPVYPVRDPEDRDPRVAWVEQDWFDGWIERWALMGFAVLDFDGPAVQVRYIDETGDEKLFADQMTAG